MKRFIRSLLVASLCISGLAHAADHLDSPSAVADGSTDITDVFAWSSSDGTKLNLIMNVAPNAGEGAAFSDAAQYVFHVARSDSFGGEAVNSDIICTFDAAGALSCWAGDQYVSGDASNAEGLSNDGGSMKVFAGLRNDPFFFPSLGFGAVVDAVKGAAPDLSFDDNGCPTLDEATATALAGLLGTNNCMMTLDFFQSHNVLALVVQVDVTAIAGEGNIMAVWASTRRAE